MIASTTSWVFDAAIVGTMLLIALAGAVLAVLVPNWDGTTLAALLAPAGAIGLLLPLFVSPECVLARACVACSRTMAGFITRPDVMPEHMIASLGPSHAIWRPSVPIGILLRIDRGWAAPLVAGWDRHSSAATNISTLRLDFQNPLFTEVNKAEK